MISISARGGISIETIVDQLNSSGSCPSYTARKVTRGDTSKGACCPMAVGNALMDMYREMQEELKEQGKQLYIRLKENETDIQREMSRVDVSVVGTPDVAVGEEAERNISGCWEELSRVSMPPAEEVLVLLKEILDEGKQYAKSLERE